MPRDYFDNLGFVLADTPIFTPAACEGTSTLFEVDYFGDDTAYLTQSGQLYVEATVKVGLLYFEQAARVAGVVFSQRGRNGVDRVEFDVRAGTGNGRWDISCGVYAWRG